MDSTERAPEPTMEEILASIRRIISDDESNSPQQHATTEDHEQREAEDAEDGAADTQIIDDIARVLSGASAPVSSEDDILDLTDLGGPAVEPMPDMPEEVTLSEEVVVQTDFYTEVRSAPDFASVFPPAANQEATVPHQEGAAEPPQSIAEPQESVAEPPQSIAEPQESVAEPPQSIAEPQEAEPRELESLETVAEPSASEQTYASAKDASQQATTALERAIAALKAGDLAAFARETEFPSAEPAPEPAPEAAPPMEEPVTSAAAEATPEMAEEEPVVLNEPELEPDPPAWSTDAPWAASESSPEADTAQAPWRAEGPTWDQSDEHLPPLPQGAARINGGSGHEAHDLDEAAASKSLEDSVKEMLRPMLRKWLDENMPRVLTAALREELDHPEGRRSS